MKKYIFGAIFLVVTAGLYVNAQSKILTLNFIAPQVKHVTEVFEPHIGEIVFQSSDSKFYGYNNVDPLNPWVALSGNTSGASLPPGTVVPYAGSSAPDGFVFADGSTLNVADQPDLYAAIGITYGGTGGSGGTFKVPDLRGIFIRGAGSQTINTISYSGTLANKENDQFQGHAHRLNFSGSLGPNGTNIAEGGTNAGTDIGGQTNAYQTDGVHNTPRVGSETRPANISLNYIIKL